MKKQVKETTVKSNKTETQNNKKVKEISSNILKKPTTTPEWWKLEVTKKNITPDCINDLTIEKLRWLKSLNLSTDIETETAHAWLC